MYDELAEFITPPPPFSLGTAADLWTDPHVAEQMLRYHLDPEVDLASRNRHFIDRSTAWLVDSFALGDDHSVLDLGCGPGLYTTRLARTGARVYGIDLSSPAIEAARAAATDQGVAADHVVGNYLDGLPGGQHDLITLIMCDYCVLGPEERAQLLGRVSRALAPDGAFVFDVYSRAFHESVEAGTWFAPQLMDGFWSPAPYFGFKVTHVYPDELVTLDRYLIVEETRTRLVQNWLQQFTPTTLHAELHTAGFHVDQLIGNLAGDPYQADAPEFAVVARPT